MRAASGAMPSDPPQPPAVEVGVDRRRRLSAMSASAVRELWVSATGGRPVRGVALLALGSLGREDMGPCSDLDLLLLHESRRGCESRAQDLANAIWYPIWDAGLELDHAVRGVDGWREVVATDVPALFGMLHARTIAGDDGVASSALAGLFSDWRRNAPKRLPEIAESLRVRAERFGEIAYLSEPDLKEARGGLRDALVLDAVAASWMTDRPHGAVDAAVCRLLDARDALQLSVRRHTHRLTRSTLEDVSRRCGFSDPDVFLSHVADAARRVAISVDATMRRAERQLRAPSRAAARPVYARGRRLAPHRPILGDGMVEYEGEVVLSMSANPAEDPGLALRMAAEAARTGLELSPVTVEGLGPVPDLRSPWTPQEREDFLAVISSGERLPAIWEALDLAGIIERWIPEWSGVRNRLQVSSAHRFTVDRHCVEVAKELAVTESEEMPPTGSRSWTVRFLTGVLHDIGKRPGAGDHSVAGERLVGPIIARMGFDATVIRDVQMLVRHHLLLSELAMTADPDDPRGPALLASALDFRSDQLDQLRALTRADTVALGGRRWTPWRRQLVDVMAERARTLMVERSV